MKNSEVNYEAVSALLHRHNVLSDAAEVHGILCGMLSGGMDPDNTQWQEALCDYINAGEPLPGEINEAVEAMLSQLLLQLRSEDFSMVMCLPDEEAPIEERGQAVIAWVQGFLLGFGVQKQELLSCSEDVKEALKDFSDIIQMDADMPETDESEQALYEVMEYVRISALLCYSELGSSDKPKGPSRTLH
ncbi:UPF0149 family protein [Paraneptunicella aestuarii]|uniref:UPF0149 family protein n=1 Tax=Paraneptunicella aestuarii TaxID=2831148 RepID=UPI001E3A5D52|nr:UPF0149 family protein [Paraneptunicella aestuarii]UAA39851.1 UPF0149 family protein [Paraneptunicella aestuarii]